MNAKFVGFTSSFVVHALLLFSYLLVVELKPENINLPALDGISLDLSVFQPLAVVKEKVAEVKPVESIPVPAKVPKQKIEPLTAKKAPEKVIVKKKKKKKPDKIKKVQKKILKQLKPEPIHSEPKQRLEKSIPSVKAQEAVAEKAAIPTVTSAQLQGLADKYKSLIRAAIFSKKEFPRQARRKRLEGTTVVGFSVESDGSIHKLNIVKSSGFDVLDRAALKAVKKVRQFDAIPKLLNRSYWEFEIAVSFKLS